MSDKSTGIQDSILGYLDSANLTVKNAIESIKETIKLIPQDPYHTLNGSHKAILRHENVMLHLVQGILQKMLDEIKQNNPV